MRVVIVRRISDIVKEHDVAVHTLSSYPDLINRYTIVVIPVLVTSIIVQFEDGSRY